MAGPSYWHVNLMTTDGVLIGISPVAAKVQLNDGTEKTFSVSHGLYERLRNDVGNDISFDVTHNVLHVLNG